MLKDQCLSAAKHRKKDNKGGENNQQNVLLEERHTPFSLRSCSNIKIEYILQLLLIFTTGCQKLYVA